MKPIETKEEWVKDLIELYDGFRHDNQWGDSATKVNLISFIRKLMAKERKRLREVILGMKPFGSCSSCDECPCKRKYADGFKTALQDVINKLKD